ncbi:MAG: polysaccharide biosynthesis/export family protein [Bryobacterales bacterium]
MLQKRWIRACAALLALLVIGTAPAQQPGVELLSDEIQPAAESLGETEAAVESANLPRSAYVIGPGDVLTVWAADLDENGTRLHRVDGQGYMNAPMVGRLHVNGMRVDELERELNSRLKVYIREPNVAVSIQEHRSQPVTIVGSVTRAGVYQLEGQKTLLEVISLAEGLRPEAGFSAKITRRLEYGEVPLPDAKLDATERYSVAEVDLEKLLAGSSPEQNIVMLPNDVISIPRAHMVYVVGAVQRAGGFALAKSEISAMQALALAGGLTPTAAQSNARILRQSENESGRVEIAVNLKDIMNGKAPDFPLGGEDILFVPTSGFKTVGAVVGQAVLQAAAGIAVWRVGRGDTN